MIYQRIYILLRIVFLLYFVYSFKNKLKINYKRWLFVLVIPFLVQKKKYSENYIINILTTKKNKIIIV